MRKQNSKCNICEKCFLNKDYLELHKRSQHTLLEILNEEKPHPPNQSSKEKKFQCNVCEKWFGYKWDLKGHIKRIHEQINHKSSVTLEETEALSTKASKNVKIHQKAKQVCHICNKIFATVNTKKQTNFELSSN